MHLTMTKVRSDSSEHQKKRWNYDQCHIKWDGEQEISHKYKQRVQSKCQFIEKMRASMRWPWIYPQSTTMYSSSTLCFKQEGKRISRFLKKPRLLSPKLDLFHTGSLAPAPASSANLSTCTYTMHIL